MWRTQAQPSRETHPRRPASSFPPLLLFFEALHALDQQAQAPLALGEHDEGGHPGPQELRVQLAREALHRAEQVGLAHLGARALAQQQQQGRVLRRQQGGKRNKHDFKLRLLSSPISTYILAILCGEAEWGIRF